MSQPLNDEQTAAVRAWADEGADLPVIQKRLGETFDVHLTFMDTRFLVADLGIELKTEEEEEVEETPAELSVDHEVAGSNGSVTEPGETSDPAQAPPAEDDATGEAEAGGGEGTDPGAAPLEEVTVTISELQRPGMMANGSATFANGQVAEWYLDQMGQLGMNPTDPEFRPSPQQMLAFQQELQRVAQQKGMA